MADAEFIVDIILRARDQTAAAFASAAGEATAFNAILDEQETKARRNAEAFRQSSRTIVQSHADVTRSLEDVDAANRTILQRQRDVEAQAKRVAAVEADHTKTVRDQISAHNDLNNALTRLTRTELEHERNLKAQAAGYKSLDDAMLHVARAREEGNAALAKEIEQNVKLDRAQQRIIQNKNEDLRADALRQRQLEQQDVVLQKLERSAQKYSKAFDSREAARFREEMEKHAQALERLGHRSQDVEKALNSAFDMRKVEQHRRGVEQLTRTHADLVKQTKAYAAELDRVAKMQFQRNQAAAVPGGERAVAAMDRDIEKARAKLATLAAEAKAVAQQHVSFKVDADTSGATGQMFKLEALKMAVGRDIHLDVDVDLGDAVLKLAAFDAMKHKAAEEPKLSWIGQIRNIGEEFRKTSNNVATFDNFMRGLFTLGIAVFFNQLIVLAGAAAGALVALAGSAIYAGGALGGALVAGLMQALPVLGILGAAITRLTAVFKAAQQQQLLQQQTAAQGEKINKRTADSTDAITNAQVGLANAHKQVQNAQQGVIDARQKAIRQLQDLILQERQASLAAKGAALDQEDAQEALARAISTGQTGDIARARLQASQAGLGVRQARLTSTRTRADLATRRSQGIEGSPEVTQAKESLEAAQQGAEQAERALAKAGRTADVAGAQALAAAGKLDFLKSQLSKSELALLTTVETFINRWRKFAQQITEPLIAGFDSSLKRINTLLKDSTLIKAARDLAGEIGKQFGRIFDHFTSGKSGAIFLTFAAEAKKNLKPVTDIIINIGDVFANIGLAASPALHTLLGYFASLSKSFADWTGSLKGQTALKDFFDEGVRQFKLWMGLLGSVGKLVMDVINPKVGGGARTGGQLVKDMTDSLTKLDNELRSAKGREFLQSFFKNTRAAIHELSPVVGALARGFAGLFNEEGVKSLHAFADVVSTVLIPAFGGFLKSMGLLIRVVDGLLQLPFAKDIAKWSIAIVLVVGTFAKLGSILKPIFLLLRALGITGFLTNLFRNLAFTIISRLGPALTFIRGAILAVGRAMITAIIGNPIIAAVVAIIAILVILQLKFHIFNKALAGIKIAAKAVIDWLKDHWKDILTVITGPFGLIVRLIVEHWDDIKGAFRRGINSIVGFMRALPGRIKNFAVDTAKTIAEAFKDLGGMILKGIVSGVRGAANFAKDIVNGIIGLVEKAINSVDKIGPIHVPDVHLPRLAQGGPIPGGYGGGDRQLILAESGEHMITKEEVRAAGGHSAIFALRALLGGGGQARGMGFAVGGEITQSQIQARNSVASMSINVDADTSGQAHKWRLMWQEMVASTRRNSQLVEARIRTMRVNMTNTFKKLREDVTEQAVGTEMSVKVHFQRLANSGIKSYKSLTEAVYEGMKYIGTATNTVLKGFDAETVNFSLDAPNIGGDTTRAATGYLGQPGERGGDVMPILVGRGEAVLNWAHQKLIEPALRAFYGFGLGDLFHRTTAYHAGGPQSLGMAGGGFTGPFGSGSAFTAVANFAKSKFGLSMTAGRTNHNYLTAYGNVSDHSTGQAGDFSDGYNTPSENAFSNFWKGKLPQTIKQLIWQGKDQLRGFPIYDHWDHVHVALQRQYAFNAQLMARLLSRAMRGLSISDLLTSTTGDQVGTEHVDRPLIKGRKGPARTIAQKALDKVRAAANALIDTKALTATPGGAGPMDNVPHFTGPWVDVMNKIAQRFHWSLADWRWLVGAESGGDPTARNPSSGAFGLGQFLGATAQAYAPLGALSTNPVKQIEAMAAYIRNRYKNPTAAKAWHLAHNWYGGGGVVPRFARGGFVGGLRRAANGLFGGETEALRQRSIARTARYRMPTIRPLDYESLVDEFGTAVTEIQKVIKRHDNAAKRLHARVGIINANLTLVTKEGGLLDQVAASIDRFGRIIGVRLKESVLRLGRDNVVRRTEDPTEEAAEAIRNMRRILTRNRSMLTRVNRLLRDTDTELVRVNRRIETLEDISPKKRTDAQKKELSGLREDRQGLVANQRALRDRALAAREAIAEQLEALYQAQVDAFTKATETTLANISSGGLNQASAERAMRKAQALGQGDRQDEIQGAQISIMQQQQDALRQALRTARSRGYSDLAKQYEDQIADLDASITEAIATRLSGAIDTVNAAATRSLADNDRSQARAGLFARVGGSGLLGLTGGAVAGAQAQAQALVDRGGILTGQQAQLQALLLRAQADNNVGQIQNLTDQLADLSGAIDENTIAQHEATVAIVQARIDQLQNRAAFQGGVFGNLGSLVNAALANTQGQNPALQSSLLTQARTVITDTLTGLQRELAGAFGIDVTGQTGTTLAETLRNLNFDGIEANFSDAQKTQFENLINAIIQNATDLEGNTQAIDALNGNLQPQGFTSTAWSWFRDAIFTGMGDVLPQYTIPSFDNGGSVVRSGIARVHPGDIAVMGRSGISAPIQEGDININVDAAEGPVPVDYIAKRMSFERRHQRASR